MKKNSPRNASSRGAAGPLRISITIGVILLAIFLVVGYIWRSLTRSEHFRVRHIVVKQDYSLDLRHLAGRNIFTLDLAQESRYISQSYPDFKSIKLSRVLPDRIYVNVRPRVPAAAVRLYKNFAVDEDGLLFNFRDHDQESGLPVITGLETKIFGPKAGEKYSTQELRLALQVIDDARGARELADCRIIRIDASSTANLTAVFDMTGLLQENNVSPSMKKPYVEVKYGGANIRAKTRLLENILVQERKELNNIKYVDLRFANPVIKFYDAEK